MKWILYILSYTVKYFLITFGVVYLFLGGYSLLLSKIKLNEFKLYVDLYDVMFISLKVTIFIFLAIFLHVVFVQIPKEKLTKNHSDEVR